jgi:c-di-AMP phosphodiesterase-like protein
MGNKNIISYTIFKKNYKQYDTKISLESINNYIDSNNDNFIFYKKTKSTKYIIYIYDIINNDDINDIMETHKDVFNIISYEDLNKIL